MLTDIAPFPDPVPAGCSFTRADLNDGVTMLRLAEGCGMILHFGGVSTEQPFEEVLGPNIRGLYHIYEAARREKARVLFASSNHSIGFHERDEPLDADTQFLPDGYYGLSKAYGELMGRMYWFKHGVENVNVRIGSCFPEPVDARMLATWLSYDDLTELCVRATLAPVAESCVVWGASDNARSYWKADSRAALGWLPKDIARSLRRPDGGQGERQPGAGTLSGGRLHGDGLYPHRPAAGEVVQGGWQIDHLCGFPSPSLDLLRSSSPQGEREKKGLPPG